MPADAASPRSIGMKAAPEGAAARERRRGSDWLVEFAGGRGRPEGSRAIKARGTNTIYVPRAGNIADMVTHAISGSDIRSHLKAMACTH